MNAARLLEERPTLRAWLEEYGAIEREYLDGLRATGVDFPPAYADEESVRAARRRLRDKGATFRNGGASIVAGRLSSACEACSNDLGSKTFALSLQCNRDCYFCFNKNQRSDDQACSSTGGWRDEVDAFAEECGGVTHVGLTGGEPLLHRREAVKFVRYVHTRHPGAHVRLYTAGDFLDEEVLSELRDAGLRELRMSVKLDVRDLESAVEIIDGAVGKLALAKRFVPDVMVEMPAIPGTDDAMRRLLARLDEIGAFGINLLEFGYPMHDWEAFGSRGFEVRNPPFPVAYDYSYPGGLPIAGSELLCLELLEFALDEGLSLGVHYCSLENKNRGQVYRQNAVVRLDERLFELDGEDFFYKAAKVFDGDAARVGERFVALGVPYERDEQDGSLLFHPDGLGAIGDLPVLPALSYNVIERTADGCAVRELKLEVAERGLDMGNEAIWGARATAWELLALTFRYPDEVLAQAVSSGEWAEAAEEVAAALSLRLPEGWGEGPGGCAGRGDASRSSAEALLHDLRVEATRLFVGAPEPAVSPYEGVWRAVDDGVQPLLFVNPQSMDVERFMRACGLGRPEGTNDPLDRVDAECELLEHLALRVAGAEPPEGAPADADLPGGSPEAAYDEFLQEHARVWLPRFAKRVAKEAREPLYRDAAAYLGAMC